MPLGTKVGLGPGHIVLHGDSAPPNGAQPPNFRPMSIVAKWSLMSATAEHLFIYVSLFYFNVLGRSAALARCGLLLQSE